MEFNGRLPLFESEWNLYRVRFFLFIIFNTLPTFRWIEHEFEIEASVDSLYFSIYWYAAVSLEEQFVIFGGTHDGTHPLDGIFGFKNDVWTKLGTLNQARYQHSSISNGKEIMIVGGLTKFRTEVWNIEFSHNRTIEPELSGYHFYPELCLVPYDFPSRV